MHEEVVGHFTKRVFWCKGLEKPELHTKKIISPTPHSSYERNGGQITKNVLLGIKPNTKNWIENPCLATPITN